MNREGSMSLSEFINKKVGKKGTKKRDKFEADYDAFKLGVVIEQAKQEQSAEFLVTNRSYISN
ncbi:MAG TPA: hypothetical protein VL443_28325 [Cyclobacteriaceae bacterium]|jgi:hypothetical protein|nr:hypothetical protein [Cyclobacteriaceae bacterium]